MKLSAGRLCLVGGILWAILALPFVRHLLEATMTRQMLVQIPLLALAGWGVAQGVPAWVAGQLARWNHRGISGLLLASMTGMVWMLPLAMDASLDDPRVTLAKFVSVPLLVGAPVALSWRRAGFVVRGVVLMEVIASTLRLGWLYLVSPVRLCSNYLLGDQQRLGKLFIAAGCTILLLLIWKLMWGHVGIDRTGGQDSDSGNG